MPHGSLENYQNSSGRFRKLLFDSCFKFLNKSREIEFLVGSAEEINGVTRKFGKNLVRVVGIGIEAVPQQFLHQGLSAIPLRLLCLSRITQKKRIDLCIEAVKYLQDRDLPAYLTIAGDGDEALLRELIQLTKFKGLESVVDFVGFVDGDDKHRLYRESDILLLPSENENFAIAIAEAIAHQVPVVVSDAVAMHSFVKAHHTGIVIRELNAEVLAEAIISLNSDYQQKWNACVNSKYLLDWHLVFNVWYEALDVQKRSQN
jgi:glycosyltransferase involved in cell wall biosynthesis